MKRFLIFAAILILASVSAGFVGCGERLENQSKKNMTGNIIDVEKESGLKLPASAQILVETDEGGHDGTKYKKWIIRSADRATLKGDVITGDNNQTFVDSLKNALPDVDFGQPKSDAYEFSDWTNEKGKWQAAAIETDRGFFIKLENIILD